MRVTLSCNNKEFLSVLNKNPNTDEGLYCTSLRNGVCIGNVINEHNYEIIFQDTKYSYTNFEHNQIDFMSFCSPELLLNIITVFFPHLLKTDVRDTPIPWLNKTTGEIDVKSCTITAESVYIDSNWVREDVFLLERYFPIKTTRRGRSLYDISISAENIVECVNILALCAFFICITNEENIYLTEDLVKKYCRVLTNINNVPYFVYYLFIKRAATGKVSVFEELRDTLVEHYKKTHEGEEITFTPNDTQKDRLEYIKDNIDLSKPILDYGCGEMRYTRYLAKRFTGDLFFSYDIEDFSDLHGKLSQRYPNVNWEFSNEKNDIPKDVVFQSVLNEVVEHNTKEDALELIREILSNYEVSTLFITTPNKNFNSFFGLGDDELRREDHIFEFTEEEFKEWVKELPGVHTFTKIGDCINGTCVTLAVKIEL